MGASTHQWFSTFKIANLGPELHVSVSPRPHLSFCAMQNSVIIARIASLYGSQTSPVDLCVQNSDCLGQEYTSLYGFQP